MFWRVLLLMLDWDFFCLIGAYACLVGHAFIALDVQVVLHVICMAISWKCWDIVDDWRKEL